MPVSNCTWREPTVSPFYPWKAWLQAPVLLKAIISACTCWKSDVRACACGTPTLSACAILWKAVLPCCTCETPTCNRLYLWKAALVVLLVLLPGRNLCPVVAVLAVIVGAVPRRLSTPHPFHNKINFIFLKKGMGSWELNSHLGPFKLHQKNKNVRLCFMQWNIIDSMYLLFTIFKFFKLRSTKKWKAKKAGWQRLWPSGI